MPPPRLLAAGRVLAGLSQRDLAKAAGVSSNSIARYESGVANMRADNLGALVEVLRGLRVRFVGESRDAELGLELVKEGPAASMGPTTAEQSPGAARRSRATS